MLTLFLKELRFFFNSITAYTIISGFLIVMGIFLWILPSHNILDSGYATLQDFFEICPYVFMFFLPAITMHTFAEEKKSGTLDLLFTTKITKLNLFLGKYLACLCIVFILLSLSTIYYLILWNLSTPVGNLDSAAIVGSYFGLFFLAAAFIAIGLFSSMLTNKQIIAFIIGTFLCIFFYQGFDIWKNLTNWSKYSFFISQFGMKYHYKSISRGVIDSRDLFYFAEFIGLFIWIGCKKLKIEN